MENAMSLFSLASVAVARDLVPLGQALPKNATMSELGNLALGVRQSQPPSGGQPAAHPAEPIVGQSGLEREAQGGSIAGFMQLLVAQIPSEALLAYTTLLALLSVGGASYNTWRWGLYAAAIVTCAVAVLASYLAQRNYGFEDTQPVPEPVAGLTLAAAVASAPAQTSGLVKLHLPYLPVLAAVLSMAVYGLTVPGSPLQFDVSRSAFAICSGSLAVGGGLMMSIFAPFLGKGNGAAAVAKGQRNVSLLASSAAGETVASDTAATPALVRAVVPVTPGSDTQDGGLFGPITFNQSGRQTPSFQRPSPGVHMPPGIHIRV
jgi:hypothetical protein